MTEQTDGTVERALDDLRRLDDEFGLTPEDVRWVRERAQTIRAALAAARAGAEVDRAYPEVECPGMFVGWSAFGATYPDTVCATSLAWPEGYNPGPVLCDADDDHRPKDIPCPACDPQGFAQYEDDPSALLAVYRRAGLLAPDRGAGAEVDREVLAQTEATRYARGLAEAMRHNPAMIGALARGFHDGFLATQGVTAQPAPSTSQSGSAVGVLGEPTVPSGTRYSTGANGLPVSDAVVAAFANGHNLAARGAAAPTVTAEQRDRMAAYLADWLDDGDAKDRHREAITDALHEAGIEVTP